jgi:hypothetical protein
MIPKSIITDKYMLKFIKYLFKGRIKFYEYENKIIDVNSTSKVTLLKILEFDIHTFEFYILKNTLYNIYTLWLKNYSIIKCINYSALHKTNFYDQLNVYGKYIAGFNERKKTASGNRTFIIPIYAVDYSNMVIAYNKLNGMTVSEIVDKFENI